MTSSISTLNGEYNYAQSNTVTTRGVALGAQTYLSGYPYTSASVSYPYTNSLYNAVGKLYFQDSNANWFHCSGSVINSPRGNLVLTAGHCLNLGGINGTPGAWYHNFWFFPGMNGPHDQGYGAPFPGFNGNAATVTASYYNWGSFAYNGNWHDDVGVLGVLPVNGRSIQSFTGGLGITFKYPYISYSFDVLGYPENFDGGVVLHRCSARVAERTNLGIAARDDGSQMVVGCDMTGGSSGGPWINSAFITYSVTSYTEAIKPNTLSGPYLGYEAEIAWQYARIFFH